MIAQQVYPLSGDSVADDCVASTGNATESHRVEYEDVWTEKVSNAVSKLNIGKWALYVVLKMMCKVAPGSVGRCEQHETTDKQKKMDSFVQEYCGDINRSCANM